MKGRKAGSLGAGFKLFYYNVDGKRNGVEVEETLFNLIIFYLCPRENYICCSICNYLKKTEEASD